MKRSLKSIAVTSILSVLAFSSVLGMANKASAQSAEPRGMAGSYLGAGVSVGVTNDGDDQSILGGNIQTRLNSAKVPVSLRGSFLYNGENSALMPLLTYDVGVAPNTNLYVGGGYSFVLGNGDHASPLGDQDAPVVTLGAETAVNRHVVLYGDAKLGIDAYRDSSDSAVSLQVGGAYRF